MAQVKREIKIPLGYSKAERDEIADEIVDYVVERSKKGLGADGKKFSPYSKSYTESLNFRVAGKRKGKVDLTLSGEMLDELDKLKTAPGKIVIGYQKDSDQNGKAEGNILGTYGQSKPIPGKARDFLEVSEREIRKILRDHPLDLSREGKKKSKERTKLSQELNRLSAEIADGFTFEE